MICRRIVDELSMNCRMDGWMDGWMGGSIDRWTDGWMDGWIKRRPSDHSSSSDSSSSGSSSSGSSKKNLHLQPLYYIIVPYRIYIFTASGRVLIGLRVSLRSICPPSPVSRIVHVHPLFFLPEDQRSLPCRVHHGQEVGWRSLQGRS